MADSFSLDVQKFADGFIDGAEQAIRGTSIKLWSAIIKSSPVDSGRFRGNWQASDASIPTAILTSTDKSGEKTIAKTTQSVTSQSDWSVFTLTNNLPYSNVIEFGGYGDGEKTVNGYSRQSPQGVVRVNIARFNKLLNEEAKRTLPA